VAWRPLAREPTHPGRGASCSSVKRWQVRHRDKVHPCDPLPGTALRAQALPLGDAAQRPFEQLLDAPRAPRPIPLHPRRQSKRKEGPRGRHGSAPEGGYPPGAGGVSQARRRPRRDSRSSRRHAGDRALQPARPIPHATGKALCRDHTSSPGRGRTARSRPAAATPVIGRSVRSNPQRSPYDRSPAVGEGVSQGSFGVSRRRRGELVHELARRRRRAGRAHR